MQKITVTSHADYITVSKNVRGKIIEIDSRRPNIIYMQYGYANGTGPWHSTSAIQYAPGHYGYETPGLWPKSVRSAMPGLFQFIDRYIDSTR